MSPLSCGLCRLRQWWRGRCNRHLLPFNFHNFICDVISEHRVFYYSRCVLSASGIVFSSVCDVIATGFPSCVTGNS